MYARKRETALESLEELYKQEKENFAELMHTRFGKNQQLILNIAISIGDIEITEFLLKKGVDPHQCDGKFNSAISIAESNKYNKKIHQLLNIDLNKDLNKNSQQTDKPPTGALKRKYDKVDLQEVNKFKFSKENKKDEDKDEDFAQILLALNTPQIRKTK